MATVSKVVDPQRVFETYAERLRRRRKSDAALREYRLTTTAFMAWMRDQRKTMEEIRRPDVEDFMADTGWAPSTQRARLTWLRAPWKYAVHELELLERSPFDGMPIELERPPQKEPKTIPIAVLKEIKERITRDTDWVLFHLLAYTGMRISEIRYLRWTDVSFKEQTIHIIGKGSKERTIPLHPALAEALHAIPMFARGDVWVLPGQRGGPLTHGGAWAKTKMMAAGHDVAPHDFRRTFATSLKENDADMNALRQILGHSKADDITLTHYVHLSQKALYRAILRVYADDPL